MARHQLLGRRHPQIVAVVLQTLAHLDDVAVPLGGQEPEPGALAFEERVGRDRRAVDDAVGRPEEGRAFEPEPPGQLREAVEDAERGVLRGRGHLGEHRRATLVDRDKVGKRPADIDPDAVHDPHPNPPPLAGRERHQASYGGNSLPRKRGRVGVGVLSPLAVRAPRQSSATRRLGSRERRCSKSEGCANLAGAAAHRDAHGRPDARAGRHRLRRSAAPQCRRNRPHKAGSGIGVESASRVDAVAAPATTRARHQSDCPAVFSPGWSSPSRRACQSGEDASPPP